MRFASVTAIALLSGAALASPAPKGKAKGCEAPKTVTVTATVTNVVTSVLAGPSSGANKNAAPSAGAKGVSSSPSSINVDMVTIYNSGSDGKQTVQACPTGQKSYDCYIAVYDKHSKLQNAHIEHYDVSTKNGAITTITVSKSDAPKITPAALVGEGNGKKGQDKHEGHVQKITKTVDVTVTTTLISTAKGGSKTTITKTQTTHTKVVSTSLPKHTHEVHVGRHDKHAFHPEHIKANKGDVVRFHFYPRNHSVTTCDEATPCVPNGVFDSGSKFTFHKDSNQFIDYPVGANSSTFFYSKEIGACKKGMVFAINPADGKFESFRHHAHKFVPHFNGTLNGTRLANGTLLNNSTRLLNGTILNKLNQTIAQALNGTKPLNVTLPVLNNGTANKNTTAPAPSKPHRRAARSWFS